MINNQKVKLDDLSFFGGTILTILSRNTDILRFCQGKQGFPRIRAPQRASGKQYSMQSAGVRSC